MFTLGVRLEGTVSSRFNDCITKDTQDHLVFDW